MKQIIAVLFLIILTPSAFSATANMSERIVFSTFGNDCYADGTSVMNGECYALVWKKNGATFSGFGMIPQAPNDPTKQDDDVWLIDYFPLAVKETYDDESTWSSCPEYTLYAGWLPPEKAKNGTCTLYLLDTRFENANGSIDCGFDSDVGEDRPRRINAYTPIEGLTDFTVNLTMSVMVGQELCGGNFDTFLTVADCSTQVENCRIDFDAVGGQCSEDPRELVYGDSIGELPTPSLNGYSFDGWFTSREGGVEMTADTPATGNATLYAHWTPNEYKIVFNGRGADGSMSELSMTWDVEKALTSNEYVRVGYTFLGWTDDEDGETVVYEDGAVVSNLTDEVDGVYSLYAVWDANTYTVMFDANGGDGVMENEAFVYDDQPQALRANEFAKANSEFLGWSTDPGYGWVEYSDGQEVVNLTYDANGEVTLYAVWSVVRSLEFCTRNGDCYAEGTPVLSGECYALVWQPKDVVFGGFTVRPPAPGALTAEGCKVVRYFPEAQNWEGSSTCDCVISGDDLAFEDVKNGKWTVYLLDTRAVDEHGDVVCGLDPVFADRPRCINAYTPIPGLVGFTMETGEPWDMEPICLYDENTGKPTLANVVAEVPADCPMACVSMISLVAGHATICVTNTASYLQYGLSLADEVTKINATTNFVGGFKQGVGEGPLTWEIDVSAYQQGFFKLLRKSVLDE